MVQSEKQIEYERQWAFFQKLWDELPNKKFCQSCGTAIYGQNKPLYWEHLLEKNKYPQFKYDKRNILLVCGDCHAKKSMGHPTAKHKQFIEQVKKTLLNG